jgi:hypothetical protein
MILLLHSVAIQFAILIRVELAAKSRELIGNLAPLQLVLIVTPSADAQIPQ